MAFGKKNKHAIWKIETGFICLRLRKGVMTNIQWFGPSDENKVTTEPFVKDDAL